MSFESPSSPVRHQTGTRRRPLSQVQCQQLAPWVLFWFYVTAVICTWDASFIMLRPHTLPGGSMAWFWYLYKYYVVVDQRYQDIEDAYVFAQSLLNYVEVVFNIITIVMHYKRSKHTSVAAFTVTVMTFWKTVLYFLMFSEFCTGGFYRRGNSVAQEIFLMVIPNAIWLIVPLAAMVELWPKLLQPQGQEGQSPKVIENGETHPEVNGLTNGHTVSCSAADNGHVQHENNNYVKDGMRLRNGHVGNGFGVKCD